MSKKFSKARLSNAARDLRNPHSREAKESKAAKLLAKVRWGK